MTKQHNNKRTMLESVVSLIETNAARTSSIPGISESIGKFRSLLDEIQNKTVEVDKATAGKAAAKRLAKAELTLAVLQVSGALHALACKRSDEVLKAKTDVQESALQSMRDTEFLSKAALVFELAQANGEALVGQGFGPEVISAFQNKIDEYESALGGSLSAIPNRKAARQRIKELMAEISAVLGDEIDKYIEFFRTETPEFYNAYFEARRIKKLGVRHRDKEAAAAPTSAGGPEMIVPEAPVSRAA